MVEERLRPVDVSLVKLSLWVFVGAMPPLVGWREGHMKTCATYSANVLFRKKWKKNNFDEMPHHGGDRFLWGKVNVTPASREQCSRLQQSRWCRYWFFAVYTAVTHTGFQWAGPETAPFLQEIWTHPNGVSIHSIFPVLTNVTKRQMDHTTSSLAIGRI